MNVLNSDQTKRASLALHYLVRGEGQKTGHNFPEFENKELDSSY